MERFAVALRRVARELDVPGPARSAILLEMAADLEAVYAHHRSRGAGEAEAARRAEDAVLGSSEVVQRLARLHSGGWRVWVRETGLRLTSGIDLLLLVAGVVPVLVLAMVGAAGALAPDPGLAGWLLLVLGTLLVVVVAVEAGRLLLDVGRPRWLPLIPLVSALAPALGVLALAMGLREVGLRAVTAAGPVGVLELAEWGARDGGAFVAGLLLGIAGLLSWFVLGSRATRRLERELDAVLNEHGRPTAEDAQGRTLELVRGRSA